MTASLSHRDATFQYQSTNLVDHRRATHHPALAHPMQGLQIQLIVALDWHKAHLRTPHCLGDGFCINVIVLVRLYVGLIHTVRVSGALHVPGRAVPGPENELLRMPRYQSTRPADSM